MSDLFEPAWDIFADILFNARGSDGSLDTPAYNVQARAIAADQLRLVDDPLDSDALDNSTFHGGVYPFWRGERDGPEADAEGRRALVIATLELSVGYVMGEALSGLVLALGGTDPVITAKHPSRIATSDGRIIRRAFMCPPMYLSAPTDALSIRDVRRVGGSRVQRIGAGRLMCVQAFDVHVSLDNNAP